MAITTSGTSITFNDATTQTTAYTGPSGVTSAVAGNGVAVSGATGAVTFSASAPGFNTVGSYTLALYINVSGYTYLGTNYAGSVINYENSFYNNTPQSQSTLSGTWKFMGQRSGWGCSYGSPYTQLICRVA